MLHWPPPTSWAPCRPCYRRLLAEKVHRTVSRYAHDPTRGCENADSAFKSVPPATVISLYNKAFNVIYI